jgi:hypothetical protein
MSKKINTTFALSLMLIITLSCLAIFTVKSASAQSIPEPNVPEFTAKYVDHSYDTPTTYTIDPYTGKTITHHGYHIDNRTIEITIKNQPFTPFNDSAGNMINHFFDVRYKGSFTDTWTTMFANQTLVSTYDSPNPYVNYGFAIQNYSGQYTTIIYKLTSQIPTNGQIDFQVEALNGYTNETYHDSDLFTVYLGFTFYGQESGWSNTQTVTINPTTPTPTAISPTPTPTVPELSWLVIAPLLLSIIPVALVVVYRRHSLKTKVNGDSTQKET